MRKIAPVLFVIATMAATLVAAAPANALFEGPLGPSTCLAGKLKCIAQAKSCLLGCHVKAAQKGGSVDPACLAKCRDRFAPDPAVPGKGCFAKVEARGSCGTDVGNAAEFSARIDAHVRELIRQLAPVPPAVNKCGAGKLRCVAKYNTCLLTRARKAAEDGLAIAGAGKCFRYLDGSPTSCFGKLELKSCDPMDPSCDHLAPTTCPTYRDEGLVRLQDDAFVDDVLLGLSYGTPDVNTQRCSDDTSVSCTSAPGGLAGCGGGLGTCEFHLGAPVPRSASGVSACVLAQWNGSLSGTFDQASGAVAGTASIRQRVYLSPTVAQPCPICAGDLVPNDGTAAGTCDSGARSGLPCDGNDRETQPSFGTTSLDCPPAGNLLADMRFDLTNTNDGTLAKTIDATSPTCNGAPGKLCVCASCSGDKTIACDHDAQCAAAGAGTCSNAAGQPRQPNSCIDTTATPADGKICMPVGNGEGVCPESFGDQHCRVETFRGCSDDGDCPADGDGCSAFGRECFPGYDGNVGDAVTVVGSHELPRNGTTAMTFGAVFCQPPTDTFAVNSAVGLPGPGRFVLDAIATTDGGPGCPTRASFVPTSKGPVTDVGWTGLDHDQSRTVGAAVTVATTCTGTPPACSCTYTGPIANPNAP